MYMYTAVPFRITAWSTRMLPCSMLRVCCCIRVRYTTRMLTLLYAYVFCLGHGHSIGKCHETCFFVTDHGIQKSRKLGQALEARVS